MTRKPCRFYFEAPLNDSCTFASNWLFAKPKNLPLISRINADKKNRLKSFLVFIRVHPRKSAAKVLLFTQPSPKPSPPPSSTSDTSLRGDLRRGRAAMCDRRSMTNAVSLYFRKSQPQVPL